MGPQQDFLGRNNIPVAVFANLWGLPNLVEGVLGMSKSVRFSLSLVTTAIAGGVLCACAWRADAATYFQTNLVSDIADLPPSRTPVS